MRRRLGRNDAPGHGGYGPIIGSWSKSATLQRSLVGVAWRRDRQPSLVQSSVRPFAVTATARLSRTRSIQPWSIQWLASAAPTNAADMEAALGPVEAGPAEGAARLPRRRDRCPARRKSRIPSGDTSPPSSPRSDEAASRPANRRFPRRAGPPDGRSTCARFAAPHRRASAGGSAAASGSRRRCTIDFDHPRDQRGGEPEIAVPPLLHDRQQIGVGELSAVQARRLRRDAGEERELARGERAPVHQRVQDRGPGRVAHQRRRSRQVRCCSHVPILGSGGRRATPIASAAGEASLGLRRGSPEVDPTCSERKVETDVQLQHFRSAVADCRPSSAGGSRAASRAIAPRDWTTAS